MVFCDGISCLCDCCADSIPTQIVYSITKRLKKWCFAIENRVCVAVESTQYPHKSYIPLQNAKKRVFWNWISCLCGCWVRLNTHKNRIYHWKILKKMVFCKRISCLCDYWVESISTQILYSIEKRLKMDFCKGILCLCYCWVDSIPTQIVYSIAKR